jgi:hypothetical protein
LNKLSTRIYYPQLPVDPKYFAGRINILDDIDRIVHSTRNGKPEHMAICGVRGIGKTSLNFKIREKVPNSCFMAYYAVSKEMSASEFVEDLIQKMNMQYQEGLGGYKKFLEKAKSISGNVESFSVLEFGLSLRKGEKTPQIAFMGCMSKFIKRGFEGIVVLIDEADLLSDEVLAMVRNCVQELQSPTYNCSVSIFISGSENLLYRLTGKHSPISRLFSTHTHELQPLTENETFEALSLPARDNKIVWKDDARDMVYQLSKGFPYVVQLFGQYAIGYCNGKQVTVDDVKKSHLDVLREIGVWYRASWNSDPSESEIQVLLAIGELSTRAKYTDISKKMGGKQVGSLLKRLVEKRCLEKDGKNGMYYLPHPLVSDYLRVNYRKS